LEFHECLGQLFHAAGGTVAKLTDVIILAEATAAVAEREKDSATAPVARKGTLFAMVRPIGADHSFSGCGAETAFTAGPVCIAFMAAEPAVEQQIVKSFDPVAQFTTFIER
jgi:hypothetical protein